jgi:hypothetical protein
VGPRRATTRTVVMGDTPQTPRSGLISGATSPSDTRRRLKT